ncbi:MAG: PIN domain-containing protein [Bacillaceae bacterium]|nr:PIN domain-containing protein [Bacillaceae bacterium]
MEEVIVKDLIIGSVIITFLFLIYHRLSEWILSFFPRNQFSFVAACIAAVLFPTASHRYLLEFRSLHRVSYTPNGLLFGLTALFYIMVYGYFMTIFEPGAPKFFLMVVAIVPIYTFAVLRTIKLAKVLGYLQKLDRALAEKQMVVDRVKKLYQEGEKRVKSIEVTKKKELKEFEQQLKQIERELGTLEYRKNGIAKEIRYYEHKRKNLSILQECKQDGVEIGIDSNILMECDDEFFDLLKGNKLVISKFVHNEWDKMKESDNKYTSRKAIKAMHRFEELQKNGSVRSITKQWDADFLKANVLAQMDMDDSIIADYLYELKNGKNIVALSDDTGFRTSARGAHLPVLDVKLARAN